MAQELKTKSMPEIGCLWTYFGHTSDDIWSASEHLLMRADASWRELTTAGDSEISPNKRQVNPAIAHRMNFSCQISLP